VTKPIAAFGGHTPEVVTLAFNADGKQVVSVSAKDVRLWLADSGKEMMSKGIPWTDQGGGPVFAIGPDGPDGPTLALVEWRRHADSKRLEPIVVLISATGGKELLAFNARGVFDKESPPNIDALAFSPDGKHLVTAGSVAIVGGPHSLSGGVVNIWDAKAGKAIRQLGERKKWDRNFQKPLNEIPPGVSTSARASCAT
jgi:WD40 repeat protein